MSSRRQKILDDLNNELAEVAKGGAAAMVARHLPLVERMNARIEMGYSITPWDARFLDVLLDHAGPLGVGGPLKEVKDTLIAKGLYGLAKKACGRCLPPGSTVEGEAVSDADCDVCDRRDAPVHRVTIPFPAEWSPR